MRWKAFFYGKSETENDKIENFGFKSERTPTQHEGLIAFENDLYALIKSVKFKRNVNISFQSQLAKDVKVSKRHSIYSSQLTRQKYVQDESVQDVYKMCTR